MTACACVSVTLAGCPDPNTYGTPRTLAPGDLQLQASISGYAGTARGATRFSPAPPSVGVRYGVADRFDVGARIVDFSALGADAKLNFLRGKTLDLAFDPMVLGYDLGAEATVSSVAVLQIHAPLLVGLNIDRDTTLLVTPGFVATLATGSAANNGLTAEQEASATSGIGGRLGIGLNVRTSDTTSIQPELTAWHEFNDVTPWVYVLGLGLNVGAQPDYSDLDEGR